MLHIGLNRAMDLIGKKQDSIRSLGEHPKDKEPVVARKGRFGPYAQWGNMVANLPKGTELTDVTLDEAVALLAKKGKYWRRAAARARPRRLPKKPATAPAAKAKAGRR